MEEAIYNGLDCNTLLKTKLTMVRNSQIRIQRKYIYKSHFELSIENASKFIIYDVLALMLYILKLSM